tara:strand:+ start:181 stop:1512 length:1332 start_codon:yes stop_codon:yes gene_type:complete
MASTYLSKTFSGTPTNNKKCTISIWFKKTKNGSETVLLTQKISSARDGLRFDGSSDRLRLFLNSANSADYVTTRVFRDINAWYHVVVAIDTTLGTAGDRVKIYINGVQETAFDASSNPSQDHVLGYGNSTLCNVGRDASDTTGHWDGVMSHIHFIDGTAYAPTVFGSTDATTGEWKINTQPNVTYGTNGYFLLKDDNSVTDQSGRGNNFTVGGGTFTKTEDCPSSVFATWNSLESANGNFSYANGNTYSAITSSGYNYVTSTLGASSGKYYCEMKANTTGGSNKWMFGIATRPSLQDNADYLGKDYDAYGYRGSAGDYYNNNNNTSYGNSYAAGDIIGVAMDLDNNKLYFSKNGTWQNSGDPTSGSTGTGAISIVAPRQTKFYHFAWGDIDATGAHTMYANFGNGYFGTTAVSSAGTNASNNGIFEYDVPAGYTALSTRGLNL